jgi:catechol 2,3-dioxygenase
MVVVQKKQVVLGTVSLSVRAVGTMRQFYQNVLGLQPLAQRQGSVLLGTDSVPIIELRAEQEPVMPGEGEAGLYHFALLYPSATELALRVKHILSTAPQYFRGSADHLVSEAFYFSDPEWNGIELYTDRDPSLWQWENGSVRMATRYIDPASYIRSYATGSPSGSGIQIGHVHLKVGDIDSAKEFYADILGFEVTAQLAGAIFVSRDRYHHHVGLNTWESEGAGIRRGNIGLASFEIRFRGGDEINRLVRRLDKSGLPYKQTGSRFTLHDPWRNQIIVTVPDESHD